MTTRNKKPTLKAQQKAYNKEARRSKKRFRRRLLRGILLTFGGLGGLAIVMSLVLPSSLGQTDPEPSYYQGVKTDLQADIILEPEESHPEYNTNPPTSGWHYALNPEEITWGRSDEPLSEETQVSYLKQGGVIIQYNCPDGCPDVLEPLDTLINRYPENVILSPQPSIESTLAITSWGYIDNMDGFDETRIESFIQKHAGHRPDGAS